METVDVLIVGAGITGSATAYALRKAGVERIKIIDKNYVASGPTGMSSGVIRTFYTHPTLVDMAKEGRDTYAHFPERVGGNAGFVQCGWLLGVAQSNQEVAEFGLAGEAHAGVDCHWLSPEEAQSLTPGLETSDLVGAVYEPQSGYADPAGAAQAYLDQARALGVEYASNIEVTGWQRRGDTVIGAETSRGPLAAAYVVVAAGPWTVSLIRMLGVELPITASRHPIVALRERSRPARPVLSDAINMVYSRPEGEDLTLVGSNDPSDANDIVDPDQPQRAPQDKIEGMVAAVSARLPSLADAEMVKQWAGVYDVSQDGFPILGPLKGIENLYIAAGMSGHGFKLAPAISGILTHAITGEADDRLRLFRSTRFAEGEPIRSTTTSSLTVMRHEGHG